MPTGISEIGSRGRRERVASILATVMILMRRSSDWFATWRKVPTVTCSGADMTIATEIPPQEETRVFLSYSRRDADFVEALEQALSARGMTVYVDRTAIEKGVDWWERIHQLIARSDAVVFVLSPDAAQSDICAREIDCALSLGKRLVPIVCRDVEGHLVPGAIAKINYIFFNGSGPGGADVGFDAALGELVAALLTDIDWVREHTRLGELARYWDATGRPPEQLLRGRQLLAAVEWLEKTIAREQLKQLDENDLTHMFIQASARASHKPGFYGWRYRFLVIPVIPIAAALAVIAIWIVDGAYKIGIQRALGVTQNSDYVTLFLTIATALFVVYVAGSVRRRYLIARRVDFRSIGSARLFALRAVIYNLLWVGAAFFALFVYLDGMG